jgi:putative CocE/NonD family hydrolase
MGGGDGRKNIVGKMFHGGRWRSEESWPLPATEYKKYYLHPEGVLSPEPPPRNAPPRRFTFDPNHPVPMIGGGYVGDPDIPGPRDQTCTEELQSCRDLGETSLPLSSRLDVLVYRTPPLNSDLEVVGPLTVKLWASSSALDTDFTAKLIDEYPPNKDYPQGYAMYLVDSIIRARYRQSPGKQILLEPGKICEFTIDLWATANLFQSGHRIRLDISSSNYPAYDINPNTGEKIGYHTKTVIAENTVYNDTEHPSHIILPIIPRTNEDKTQQTQVCKRFN